MVALFSRLYLSRKYIDDIIKPQTQKFIDKASKLYLPIVTNIIKLRVSVHDGEYKVNCDNTFPYAMFDGLAKSIKQL